MQFLISTTGTSVLVKDLGLYLAHPTVNQDLAQEFTPEEIAASADLTAAIHSGLLAAQITTDEYGLINVDGYYYSPTLFLEESLTYRVKELIVTEDELSAAKQDTPVYASVFPKPVSSTTSGSGVLVSTTSSFETWLVDGKDVLIITGSAAAGTYTVNTVLSQTMLTVVEPIVTTIGVGTFTIYQPTGASRIGLDSTGFASTNATNVQTALAQIDGYFGNFVTPVSHHALDDLVHDIAESSYEEYVYSGANVVRITVWTSATRVLKIRESIFIYAGNTVTSEVITQYDGVGSVVETLTKSYNYSGVQVANIVNVDVGL